MVSHSIMVLVVRVPCQLTSLTFYSLSGLSQEARKEVTVYYALLCCPLHSLILCYLFVSSLALRFFIIIFISNFDKKKKRKRAHFPESVQCQIGACKLNSPENLHEIEGHFGVEVTVAATRSEDTCFIKEFKIEVRKDQDSGK